MRFAAVLPVCAFVIAPSLHAECDASRISTSVFRVETENQDGSRSTGSAVLVGQDRLLTNCHVTRHAKRIDVAKPAHRWGATIAARDAEHDLCLLAASKLDGEPVTMSSSDALRISDRVCAAGYPAGGPFVLSEGHVEALHAYDRARVIQTSAAFSAGASGGGLFDRNGHLVGILTFKSNAGGAYHFALPTEWAGALYAEAPTGAAKPGKEAFWERLGNRQPNFMRAVALEAERNWRGLLEFARTWAKTDTNNPQCWISAGLALLHLKQPSDASDAFNHAAAIDPEYAAPVAASLAANH